MSFWAIQKYEYWDPHEAAWTPRFPAACEVKGLANPPGYEWRLGTPRTEVNCTPSHCIYDKLWYNNGRYYLLVDGAKPVVGWKLTRNQDLHVVHVDDAQAFVDSINHRVLPGDTLIADYIYFLHPTAIGHWSEMMHPLYSILKQEHNFARPVDHLVLLHLKRVHLMEWGRAVIAATLGTGRQILPPLIMQQEVDSVWGQIPAPLEGFAPDEWVCFERALVVRDIFTGGTRTWLSQEDAQTFRRDIYKIYELPPPMPRRVPRVITFQMKRANRRIINQQAFLDMFREFGEVRLLHDDILSFVSGQGLLSRDGHATRTDCSQATSYLEPSNANTDQHPVLICTRNLLYCEMLHYCGGAEGMQGIA
ncbi:hypothetical protein WJX84_007267 [Apatococcus fuscideae]|uniref:Uncharacterized protein n=1 Tax=Apatococcus fuscideae TaxID=2026836 RepID=A0AAW1RQW3_9CHLO